MPVEIKELIIRTTVNDDSKQEGSEGVGNTSSQDHMISECVNQVLEILKEKKER